MAEWFDCMAYCSPCGSLCVTGYFEQFGRCVACPASGGASAAEMLGILALLLTACFLFFRFRHLLPVDVLKLGLSMLQVSVVALLLVGVALVVCVCMLI